ncbi:hypothetical protein [Actinoplanes sp. NPDC051859]|uniref:hypothetical protein n=1 Tax=Actinoplanes sp. NPDC051859 TaxID=3363909 RepID=UPI00378ADE64
MSVPTHEVLPTDCGIRLPSQVRAALVSLGSACNLAALALNQATLGEITATVASEGAHARGGDVEVSTADMLAVSALSYVDQLTVVYTIITARYAAYAAATAFAIAADCEPAAPGAEQLSLLPSHLLREPEALLPSIGFAQDTASTPLAEQQDHVAQARQDLMQIIKRHLDGSPISQYDDPAAVARRLHQSTDLSLMFATALHNYAGTTAWAIGVFTGPSPEYD